MACRLLAAAVLLGLASGAVAQPGGESRSKFVPRKDGAPAGLAQPVLAAQAKSPPPPPMSTPGKTDPGKIDPGKAPELKQPDKGPSGTIPGAPGTPQLPGLPGQIPPAAPGLGGPGTGLSGRPSQDPYEAYIRLDPPGRERLFGSRDTERELEERMRQERKDLGGGDPIQFPEKPELTTESYQTRQFAPTVCLEEPSYIVYRRLYFEEKNSERYGWDLGPIQPVISTLYFLKDVACLPHNFASFPCRRFDTNAGQCQPGDPVPYLCYPPELTWSGLLAEAGVIGLLFWVIP